MYCVGCVFYLYYLPAKHSVDILIVSRESKVVFHVAFRFKALGRDNLAHAKLFGVLPDLLDVP